MCFAGAPPRIPAPSHPRESAARSTAAAAKKRPRLGRGRSQAHKMKFAHRTLPVSRYRPLKVEIEHKAPCQVCICTKISGRRQQPNGTCGDQSANRAIGRRACDGTLSGKFSALFDVAPSVCGRDSPPRSLASLPFTRFVKETEIDAARYVEILGKLAKIGFRKHHEARFWQRRCLAGNYNRRSTTTARDFPEKAMP